METMGGIGMSIKDVKQELDDLITIAKMLSTISVVIIGLEAISNDIKEIIHEGELRGK